MDEIDRIEMLTNRIKTALYMQRPGRRKAYHQLGKRVNGKESFCFIGHMCEAMKIPRTEMSSPHNKVIDYEYDEETGAAPQSLMHKLGLVYSSGKFLQEEYEFLQEEYGREISTLIRRKTGIRIPQGSTSIVGLNDQTKMRVSTMGKILGAVVCGGPGTPFTKIEVTEEEFEQAYSAALEDPMFADEVASDD